MALHRSIYDFGTHHIDSLGRKRKKLAKKEYICRPKAIKKIKDESTLHDFAAGSIKCLYDICVVRTPQVAADETYLVVAFIPGHHLLVGDSAGRVLMPDTRQPHRF